MSRERLAKLLGMLGSEFDGERANAARMIADMAKKEGKGVADYVMSGGGPQIVYRDRIVEKTVYRDRPVYREPPETQTRAHDPEDLRAYRPKKPRAAKGPDTIISGLRWARDFPEHLSGFEVEFIDSLLMKCANDLDLTWKQERVAHRIILKVQGAEGEPLV